VFGFGCDVTGVVDVQRFV